MREFGNMEVLPVKTILGHWSWRATVGFRTPGRPRPHRGINSLPGGHGGVRLVAARERRGDETGGLHLLDEAVQAGPLDQDIGHREVDHGGARRLVG